MSKALRIGITMREVRAQDYDEARDALARDWGRFMAEVLPEAAWLPIPNLGAEAATAFCERWELQGLILSGGDDLGASPIRDVTEVALLAYFSARDLPILGVCRGLQLMWVSYGGKIENISGHAGVTHAIAYLPPVSAAIGAMQRTVNSYHAYGIQHMEGIGSFDVIARAQDGSIEGAQATDGRMLGVMWHPEREQPVHLADRVMVRKFFGWDGEGGA